MFFKRRKRIRNLEDQQLMNLIDDLKVHLSNQQAIVSKSVDPSEEVLYEMKLTEAKYLFLLREARVRYNEKE
ncbi:YaaL family protein [Bacillus sp. FJAT-45350]|uniref:YaaL family protein n=1 Tax=Bacillus sp. FJAT-45350 TaxID=2011014 RepID=UPI000BB8DEE1|nr:YaaL family protein [Bacillus sp. FJAT-45350]